MIFYLLPNTLLAVIAVMSFGLQLGWDKLITSPYYLLLIYLGFSGLSAFWMKWDEPKEDEEERKRFIEDIKKAVSDGVAEALKK